MYRIFLGFSEGRLSALTEGGERALVANLVQPNLRGTAYGLYHFSIGISTLPSSLLMGLLWEKISPGVAFGTGALLALLAAVMLWVILRNTGDRP
jgi:predicted MFS family arabinose efflux permease